MHKQHPFTIRCRTMATLVCFTTAFWAVGIRAAPTTTEGLVLWYDFENVEDGTLRDRSGRGNDATLYGGEAVASEGGRAVRFDGVDDYAELPAVPLDSSRGFTVEFRIQADHRQLTGDTRRNPLLLGEQVNLTVNRSFTLRFDRCNQFYLEYGNGKTSAGLFAPPSLRFTGQWHHLAIVLSADRLHYYLDGVHYGGVRLSLPITPKADTRWKLGGWPWGHVRCAIDDLRIYDRPLSRRLNPRPLAV